MIWTSTPRNTPITTIVTVPPSAPDLVCWMALVTISDVSKVAASVSAPTSFVGQRARHKGASQADLFRAAGYCQ